MAYAIYVLVVYQEVFKLITFGYEVGCGAVGVRFILHRAFIIAETPPFCMVRWSCAC